MEATFIDIPALSIRVTIQLVAIAAIVFLLYFKGSGSKEFCFSYIAIGIIVFALCTLLERVKLELGFALGLFAIFGIIRYRTITIPIKEMTYLFVIIGVSVINALAGSSVPTSFLAAANLAILLCLGALELFIMRKKTTSILMRYEKVENLHPSKKKDLHDDLKDRLGIDVVHYEIEDVDFLRDTANLRIYFTSKSTFKEVQHVPQVADSVVFDR
ncbi:MAG: DUF4956 domain-containing protein [Opitutales bacterium]|nr:DUF4956 domain-containing protein [Opitutales bacterium]